MTEFVMTKETVAVIKDRVPLSVARPFQMFNGIPIITDHRIPTNEFVMMEAWLREASFRDRSMVREDCDCNYCKWTP